MLKKYLLLIVCLFLCSVALAQSKAIDSLYVVYYTTKQDTTKNLALIEIAYSYYNTYPDSTIFHAQKALEQAKKINFQRGIALAMNRLAIGYQLKGNPQSLEMLEKALVIQKQIKDFKGGASTLNSIANIYRLRGNYVLAMQHYQKALLSYEYIKDKQGIASTLNNIGIIYNLQENYDKALVTYKESLKIKEDINDKQGMSVTLNNIGNVYSNQNQYVLALQFFEKSLAIQKERKDYRGIATCLNNIGEVYTKQEYYEEAMLKFQEALAIRQKVADKQGIMYSLISLAKVYQKQKLYDKSIAFAQQAFALTQELKMPKEQAEVSKVLYESYKASYQLDQALRYLEEYKFLNDSLFNIEKTKEIANIEAQTALDKKQKEIALLEKENYFQHILNYVIGIGLIILAFFAYFTYISKQKEKKAKEQVIAQAKELQNLNILKNRLLSIISHDLRSPMSALKGLIDILDPKIINQAELESIKQELLRQFENTDDTLQNILLWTQNQMKGEVQSLEKCNLKELVQENIDFLYNIAKTKQISLANEVQENINIFIDRNHLRIILRNLIANAIKFTKASGEVAISSEILDSKKVKVIVQDNGIGMTKEQQEKLFTDSRHVSLGTSGEKGIGLGLILVKELIEKNHSFIEVTSELGQGSTFSFILSRVD